MSIVDTLFLGMVLLAVVLVSAWIIRRKKQGKSGCGCCSYQRSCKDKSGG
jgi:hypothetical protein